MLRWIIQQLIRGEMLRQTVAVYGTIILACLKCSIMMCSINRISLCYTNLTVLLTLI